MKTDTLSKSEIEVMAALWRLGSGSVAEIQDEMHRHSTDGQTFAYTTIATHLSRMVDKSAVAARKIGRAYQYSPTEKRVDYQQVRLGDLVRQFFDGRPSSLASRFIETNTFTREELNELRRLIDEKEPE